MTWLRRSLAWMRAKVRNLRDLVSGDDLDEAQSHRSDERDPKVNPGTGGGFPIGGGSGGGF